MRDLGADFCPVCRRRLDAVFAGIAHGQDPIGRDDAEEQMVVTNATAAGIFVACASIAGPGCSPMTWIDAGKSAPIATRGGDLYLDTSTVAGAPVKWVWRRLHAPKPNISIVADAAFPIR